MSEKATLNEAAWTRSQLTIRLTAERKSRLSQLAARDGLAGPPGDAIDHAIELALGASPSSEPTWLVEAVERLEARELQAREDAANARAALSQVAQELAKLRALIAALADEAA